MMRQGKCIDRIIVINLFTLLCSSGVIPTVSCVKNVKLHVAGLFPISGSGGWQGGQACQPAASMALADVNESPYILPGYHLLMHWNDSECEPGLGAAAMYDLLYHGPNKLILLAGCDTVCTTVAEAANLWNLIVLCYGASSPALSNRNRFQTLFRTHPSAIILNPARIFLLNKFKWTRIAILQQAEEVFLTTGKDLEERCQEANIEVVTRQTFLTDPTVAVRNLRRHDVRIIVGLFYVNAARRVLCEIYKQKLYGKSYVWILMGWYENNWYELSLESENLDCTKEEMKIAAEGHLTTEAILWNQDNRNTVSGMTVEDFRLRLHDNLKHHGYDIDNGIYPEGYQEAPLAYDAVWAVAIAFNRTIQQLGKKNIRLADFHYNNTEIKDEIMSAMEGTTFLGVSGRVAFSAEGDRIALTQIEQMQRGNYRLLGYYDVENYNITWFSDGKWTGGRVPQDRTYVKMERREISVTLVVVMSTIAIVGVLWVLVLIVFTYIFRDRKAIQLSNPMTNTLMLIGFSLCFASVFLFGMDGEFVPLTAFSTICTVKTWVLSVGFTLAYGSMLTTVWRVHRLTRPNLNKPETTHQTQPGKLYLLVTILVGIEITFLTVYTVVDPLERVIETFELERPDSSLTDEDFVILPYLEHCQSHTNIWLGITYSFKGLLVIFGLFFAYETRSTRCHHINDSHLVGMSIYNVAVLCFVTTPLTILISSQQDVSFALVSLAIIFSSMIAMGIIFMPKVIDVAREGNGKADRSSIQATGTIEEDEDRYQKLLSENHQLKDILEQKEKQLESVKNKLKKITLRTPNGPLDEKPTGDLRGGRESWNEMKWVNPEYSQGASSQITTDFELTESDL